MRDIIPTAFDLQFSSAISGPKYSAAGESKLLQAHLNAPLGDFCCELGTPQGSLLSTITIEKKGLIPEKFRDQTLPDLVIIEGVKI